MLMVKLTLYARFEITEIDPENKEIEIKSWIENQDGQNVIEGKDTKNILHQDFGERYCKLMQVCLTVSLS